MCTPTSPIQCHICSIRCCGYSSGASSIQRWKLLSSMSYVHVSKLANYVHSTCAFMVPTNTQCSSVLVRPFWSGGNTWFVWCTTWSVWCTTWSVWCTTWLAPGNPLHHLVWIAIMIFIAQSRLISTWPEPYSHTGIFEGQFGLAIQIQSMTSSS